MEDLIPLIIGVLWLLYTFYSRGQKKKARKEPYNAEKKADKPTFLEQLLAGEGFQLEADDPDEPLEPIPYEQPETVAAYKARKEAKTPFLSAELSDYGEEGQSQFGRVLMEEEEEDENWQFSPLETGMDPDEFDLRKAVVYSAILEAPYIDYK